MMYLFRMQYPSESTPSEFRALLGCLRVARKSGLQICVNRDLFEKKSLWRGLIDESTLTKNMFHQDNEVWKIFLNSDTYFVLTYFKSV